MERQDFLKSYNCAWIGEASHSQDKLPLFTSAKEFLAAKDAFATFVFIHIPKEEVAQKNIDELISAGFPRDQILWVNNYPINVFLRYRVRGVPLEALIQEQQRSLLVQLELCRQEKLTNELITFQDNKKILDEAIKSRAYERARLAHAFCYLWKMKPRDHAFVICMALNYELGIHELKSNFSEYSTLIEKYLSWKSAEQAAWPGDFSPEMIFIESAEHCIRSYENFRMRIRQQAIHLPFRFRSELMQVMEKCLAHLSEGRKDVA